MAELKKCPFCGSADLYETYTEEYSGTKNPEIFCNSCKAIFSIEDDSPYMRCDEDYKYRKEKTKEAWNKRAHPEIIRCKDCKYHDKGQNESESWNQCGLRPWLYVPTGDEEYCSHAERR